MPTYTFISRGNDSVVKLPIFTWTPTATVNGSGAPLTVQNQEQVTITTPPTSGQVVAITYTEAVQEQVQGIPAAVGQAPRGSATPGNPLNIATGLSALPAAVTTGRNVDLMADLMGRQVVQQIGLPQLQESAKVTAVLTTAETTLIAATASVRRGLTDLCIANRDSVAHTVDFRGTTGGSVQWTMLVPAGQTLDVDFSTALWQAAVNTNWTYQLRETSTTAVEISYACNRVNY